jgi:hypothetical protein
MAEEADTPSSSDEDKPFFAIDAEDVAEATAAATATATATAPSSTTPQPPQPMMLGTLSNPATTPAPISGASSQMSAAEGEMKANPWGAPTPQLTGDINAMNGQGMFVMPAADPQQPERFRWGQFFAGLFLPFIVLFVFGVGAASLEPEYQDPWRYETVELVGQDGTTFQYQVTPTSDEFFESMWAEFEYEGEWYRISCYVDLYYDGGNSGGEFPVYQMAQETYNEVEIGSYSPSNQTVWFSLSNITVDSLTVEIEYVDEDIYNDTTGLSDGVFCLLPLAFVVGTIVAFFRGNRAFGFGMLTSLGLMVVLPFFFVFLLIVAFSGL